MFRYLYILICRLENIKWKCLVFTLRESDVRDDLLPVVKGHHILQRVSVHHQKTAVIQTHC